MTGPQTSTSTIITYNGVTMYDVLTEGIEYINESDPSGVDPLFLRVRATFTAYVHLHGQINENIQPGTGLALTDGSDLPTGWNNPVGAAVYEQLVQPRRRFVMKVAGKTMFNIWPSVVRGNGANQPGAPASPTQSESPNGFREDIDNGPKPEVTIQRIIGNSTMQIRFSVSFAIIASDEYAYNSQYNAGLIGFKWWFTENLDGQDYRTTRTTFGWLRVRNHRFNPFDVLRNAFVMPPLVYGFKRERISIQSSPDMLTLNFTVTDVEEHYAPPSPATWWRLRHRISTPEMGGAIVESTVSLDLKAPKTVPKQNLFWLATRIIDNRTKLIESINAGDNGAFMYRGSFEDDITGGGLSAEINYKHHPKSDDPSHSVLNFLKAHFATPFVFDDQQQASITAPGAEDPTVTHEAPYDRFKFPRVVRTRAETGLYGALLGTPQNPPFMPQNPGTPDEEEFAEAIGESNETTAGGVGSSDEGQIAAYYTNDHERYPYMTHRVASRIEHDDGVFSFPLSGGPQRRALVQMNQGRTTRYVSADSERIEAPPTMLSMTAGFTQGGATHTLLDASIQPMNVLLAADGRHRMYRVQGVWIYDLDQMVSDVQFPAQQFHTAPQANVVLATPGSGAIV